jgi:hypothetical protein
MRSKPADAQLCLLGLARITAGTQGTAVRPPRSGHRGAGTGALYGRVAEDDNTAALAALDDHLASAEWATICGSPSRGPWAEWNAMKKVPSRVPVTMTISDRMRLPPAVTLVRPTAKVAICFGHSDLLSSRPNTQVNPVPAGRRRGARQVVVARLGLMSATTLYALPSQHVHFSGKVRL